MPLSPTVKRHLINVCVCMNVYCKIFIVVYEIVDWFLNFVFVASYFRYGNTVTVLSMNVRGLFSSVKKRNDVFDWAKGKNTSIVCFQETHSSKEVEKLWEDEWGDTCLFSHFNNRSAGVCVMFKKGLDYTVHDSKIDQNGRYIILDISLFDQRLTFVSLYGYNSDEPKCLMKL